MSRKKKKEDGNYKPDTPAEQTFVAYIVKGNRQVVRREVSASKRFRVDEEMYLIRPECIFLKNVDGKLRSVSYYREGNPNPYDFEGDNLGVSPADLDRIYAEDFYHIVTNLQISNRALYILLVVIINFGLSLAFDIGVTIHVLL
jgi:hypothetical protein